MPKRYSLSTGNLLWGNFSDISVKDFIDIFSAISVKFQRYFNDMSVNVNEISLNFSAISLKFQRYFTEISVLFH